MKILKRLLLVGVVFAILVGGLRLLRQHGRAEFERAQQEHWRTSVASAANGHTQVSVMDPELMSMLADDPDCRENVAILVFMETGLSDPRFNRVRELANLEAAVFYCCHDIDNVLGAMVDLQHLESITFELSTPSNEAMKSLAASDSLKKIAFEQVMADEQVAKIREWLPNIEIEASGLASLEPNRWPPPPPPPPMDKDP